MGEAENRKMTLADLYDLTREELASLLGQCQYGIHMTEGEHYGIAIAEMILSGCIPFVHNSGGQVEVVNRESKLIFNNADDAKTKILAVYHDNPEITDEGKLRTSVCVTVPTDTEVDGEVGKMTIPGGTYAVGHFEINDSEYEDAWNALYGTWLPASGYQPEDGVAFESYLNDPNEHPEKKCIVDIYLPVKPL